MKKVSYVIIWLFIHISGAFAHTPMSSLLVIRLLIQTSSAYTFTLVNVRRYDAQLVISDKSYHLIVPDTLGDIIFSLKVSIPTRYDT